MSRSTPRTGPVPVTGSIRAAWSDDTCGDLRPTPGPLGGRALEQWTATVTVGAEIDTVHWVDQRHGNGVVLAGRDSADGRDGTDVRAEAGGVGDALVAEGTGGALAILTADCASVALGSDEGVFGAVHAGWRGLMAGVVEATVAAMRSRGATHVVGVRGPCIHPDCYEFSEADLAGVATRYGSGVRGRTSSGRPALDLPATVSAALRAGGADEQAGPSACTACGGGYFSHRARADRGRLALVVWSAAVPQ